jgi:hypothetical protein
MGSFLERLHVESVPGLYCTKNCGHPVKACAFLRKGGRRFWKGGACVRQIELLKCNRASLHCSGMRVRFDTALCNDMVLVNRSCFLFKQQTERDSYCEQFEAQLSLT